MTITYLLPILAALLIVLFYMGLPSLKECPLKRAEPAERKMRRGDWLAAAVIALPCGTTETSAASRKNAGSLPPA